MRPDTPIVVCGLLLVALLFGLIAAGLGDVEARAGTMPHCATRVWRNPVSGHAERMGARPGHPYAHAQSACVPG